MILILGTRSTFLLDHLVEILRPVSNILESAIFRLLSDLNGDRPSDPAKKGSELNLTFK